MKKVLFFISWLCCCFSIQAQHVRVVPESEYKQFTFTYEQMLDLVIEKYNTKIDVIIKAYYDSTNNSYYWMSLYDKPYPYYNYMKVNAMTGCLLSEGYRYETPPQMLNSNCIVHYDPNLAIMKRRLLANFETVDWDEYNKYKKGKDYSVKTLPGGLEGVWEKGDTAFRYYESILNKGPAKFLLHKEFYANGYIKEKGIQAFMENCYLQMGLWYYFDPEGNLVNVVDEEGRRLCLLTNEEMIAYCKKHLGYSKRIDDEYRVQMAGLPGIQIDKTADFFAQKSKWTICWYQFEPDLVKTEFKIEGQMWKLLVISHTKTYISLEKELQRLKEEEEKK